MNGLKKISAFDLLTIDLSERIPAIQSDGAGGFITGYLPITAFTGSGITAVIHDASLDGDGTALDPLSVKISPLSNNIIGVDGSGFLFSPTVLTQNGVQGDGFNSEIELVFSTALDNVATLDAGRLYVSLDGIKSSLDTYATVGGTFIQVGITGGGSAATLTLANGTLVGLSQENFTTAFRTIVNNTSGTNTGDNAVNTLYSGITSNATHTGDATGATVLTLATVNSNVGVFGDQATVPIITANAKGLITSVVDVPIEISQSQVLSLITDLASKQALNAKLTAISALANAAGVLTNDGAGNFSYSAGGGGFDFQRTIRLNTINF